MGELYFFFVVLFVSWLSTTNSAGDANTLIYSGCSQLKYAAGTQYQYNLNNLLTSLSNAAGFAAYSNFTSFLSSTSSPVYGLYQCNGDLSFSDCESCVRSAITQLSFTCPSASGAAVRLRGCLVRYGNESFLGKPDKSLQFKNCGPRASGKDVNLVGMRDSVLGGIMAEPGPYRVSEGGYVYGSGQCVGDQTQKQCNDCLSEAVADLRNWCGLAVSGEVYLGKCSAVYSSRGAYPPSHGNDHASEAGKDLAIIIGIVAAVVLIFLFLKHLRKSADEKGKH